MHRGAVSKLASIVATLHVYGLGISLLLAGWAGIVSLRSTLPLTQHQRLSLVWMAHVKWPP